MKPCEYREALDDGRIICEKITEGNPEVNPNICRRCPVTSINCQHLRFTLRKVGHKPIFVRYGNGATEVWDDNPPAVDFVRGACAEKVMPISSAQDCAGCQVHCPAREVVREREPAHGVPVTAPAGNVIPFRAIATRTSSDAPARRVMAQESSYQPSVEQSAVAQ